MNVYNRFNINYDMDVYTLTILLAGSVLFLITFSLILYTYLKKGSLPCPSTFASFILALKAPIIVFYALNITGLNTLTYIDCGKLFSYFVCDESWMLRLQSQQFVYIVITIVHVIQIFQWVRGPPTNVSATIVIPLMTVLAAIFSVLGLVVNEFIFSACGLIFNIFALILVFISLTL